MFSTLSKVMIALVTCGFMSSSFAEYNATRNQVNCVGDTCRHVKVHKHCNNGHCVMIKKSNTWN